MLVVFQDAVPGFDKGIRETYRIKVKSKSSIYFIFFISKPGNNHINKHIKSIRNIHNAITEKEIKKDTVWERPTHFGPSQHTPDAKYGMLLCTAVRGIS